MNLNPNQKPSAILRHAAELVNNYVRRGIDGTSAREYGCHAIGLAGRRAGVFNQGHLFPSGYALEEEMPTAWKYFSMFSADTGTLAGAWFRHNAQHRIMALTMAATIAEAEGN